MWHSDGVFLLLRLTAGSPASQQTYVQSNYHRALLFLEGAINVLLLRVFHVEHPNLEAAA